MFFFFNDTATTEIYTLSLHDALPIFTHAQVVNAARYFEFNKDTDTEADLAVRSVVADLSGAASIDGIVRRTKLAGRAYRAVVRAIFANTLTPAADGIISPKTFVSPSHAGGRF